VPATALRSDIPTRAAGVSPPNLRLGRIYADRLTQAEEGPVCREQPHSQRPHRRVQTLTSDYLPLGTTKAARRPSSPAAIRKPPFLDAFSGRRAGAQTDFGGPGRVAGPRDDQTVARALRSKTGQENQRRVRSADAAARARMPSGQGDPCRSTSRLSRQTNVNLDNPRRIGSSVGAV
jgi:hypothetical protein